MVRYRGKRIQAHGGSILYGENTSEANYVWLPIRFDEAGNPYIEWRRAWTVEEFAQKQEP